MKGFENAMPSAAGESGDMSWDKRLISRTGRVMLVLIFLSTPVKGHAKPLQVDGQQPETRRYEKRIYSAKRLVSEPPKIDGRLDDSCWSEGEWSGGYRQQIPIEAGPPSQETEIKILYDQVNIYVAIRAYDTEPDKIDRHLGRRDALIGDIVGVCFDSYFDHRTGFEFDLTAAGGKIDLVLLNDRWDTSWDAVWYGKVAQQDSAWTAEMQIPLSQLRYGNREEHVWGLHAWRWINRLQEEDQWNLFPRDTPARMHNIGELHGIRGIKQSRGIELLPYGVGKLNYFQREAGNPFATGRREHLTAGVDGKIGLSSDFTLDFTVNPDFGQVEADPSVLNLTAYETFFEEKRPFFLEGKNILEFPFGDNILFYSRRIGQAPTHYPETADGEYVDSPENTKILTALKLTGKTKEGLSFGIIESVTAKENADIRSGDQTRRETVEPLANYWVGRIQKDIHKGNTLVGGIFTATNRRISDNHLKFMNRFAYTGGFDFRQYWGDKTYFLDVKSVFSYVGGTPDAVTGLQQESSRYYQRADADYLQVDSTATCLSGHGMSIELGKGGNGRWRFSEGVNWVSPGLEFNDLGYLRIADRVDHSTSIGYVVTEPKGIFRDYSLQIGQSNGWNFGGEYLGSRVDIRASALFSNKWNFDASIIRAGNSLDTGFLRGGPAMFVRGFLHNSYSIQTDESKRLAFSARYHFHFFDDRISKVNDFSTGIRYKMTETLLLSVNADYSSTRDYFYYLPSVEFGGEKRYPLAQLDRKTLGAILRIDFSISPELTIQYYGNPYVSIGEYSDYKRVSDPRARDYARQFFVYPEGSMVLDSSGENFAIDENRDGEIDYSIEKPDFNFREFRSNLVLRWEYKPGSTFYFVWAHGRSQYTSLSTVSLTDNVEKLFDIYPENVFLVKFNYWLSI